MTLPTVFSWPLIIPSLPAPGSIPSGSYLAPGAGISVSNPNYMSEAELLSVLDRIFPEWYLQPLKDPGPGYEIYQAWAAALERVSLAVGRTEASLFVIYSHGGARATGTIEFYRQAPTAGGFVVKRGTVVRTSKTNRSFVLRDDVTFAPADLVQQGVVDAAAPGFEYNVKGPVSTADGTVLPGEIDTIPIPILDPLFAEPTIQVRQVSDMAGGQPTILDQLGLDREIPRMPDETDEVYKGRIRQLPDTVSPDALRRQLDAIFLVLGLEYDLIETWENRYNSGWDTPVSGVEHYAMGLADPDGFCYDDPRTDLYRNRWMDENDCMSGLVLVVPEVGCWADRSIAFNDLPAYAETTYDITQHMVQQGLVIDSDFNCFVPPSFVSGAYWRTRFRSKNLTADANAWEVWMTFRNVPGSAGVEVRDGERFNTTSGLWEVYANAIGIRVTMDLTTPTASPTVDEVEDAVDAQSARISCLKDLNTADFLAGWGGALAASLAPYGYGPMTFSGGGADPGQETARGRRARSAFDSVDVDFEEIFVGFLDGYDHLRQLFYLRLWDLLKKVKGGGTHHSIEMKGY